jgi:hypothetical protein
MLAKLSNVADNQLTSFLHEQILAIYEQLTRTMWHWAQLRLVLWINGKSRKDIAHTLLHTIHLSCVTVETKKIFANKPTIVYRIPKNSERIASGKAGF